MSKVIPQVGMGVTVTLYTDRVVYTIVRVSDSGKNFWAVEDKVTKNPNFTPDFRAGGFFGTVVNQDDQTWIYAPGDEEPKRFSQTKNGNYSIKGNKRVRVGVKSYYYDYNF